jgi:hypothetical protein
MTLASLASALPQEGAAAPTLPPLPVLARPPSAIPTALARPAPPTDCRTSGYPADGGRPHPSGPAGPHDLRHTFATWLEDAAIPSRVIDELIGHTSGRRDRGAGGSPMGRIYRETTPTMMARVTAALDDRIGRVQAVAAHLLREGQDSRVVDGGEGL